MDYLFYEKQNNNKYFQPKYYFIESPQSGKMEDYIHDKPYHDVDYCRYSDWGYRKRARIWTNPIGFNPNIRKHIV